MRRLFVDIKIPSEVEDQLKKIKGLLENIDGLRATPDFHCTTNFIGEVEDNDADIIIKKLSEIKCKKFKAKIGSIGFFPNKDYIKIIYVGLNSEAELFKLNEMINHSLNIKDDREFKPHITMARVKFLKNKDIINKLTNINLENREFLVDRFCLMESKLAEEGPIYTAVKEFLLD